MIREVSVALVHHPVLDRDGATIVTAVTNLDVHDLSRSSRTYGVRNVFIVHPVEAQRELIDKVRRHWTEGAGGKRIPDRVEAMERVRIVETLSQARAAVGPDSLMWTTAAGASDGLLSFADARRIVESDGPPILLVYGTGWGLTPEVHAQASARLEPIAGRDGWNHLSVRAAVAISLDRLLST